MRCVSDTPFSTLPLCAGAQNTVPQFPAPSTSCPEKAVA